MASWNFFSLIPLVVPTRCPPRKSTKVGVDLMAIFFIIVCTACSCGWVGPEGKGCYAPSLQMVGSVSAGIGGCERGGAMQQNSPLCQLSHRP
jgi:hypothetical protein